MDQQSGYHAPGIIFGYTATVSHCGTIKIFFYRNVIQRRGCDKYVGKNGHNIIFNSKSRRHDTIYTKYRILHHLLFRV